ncbi:hypothetical protein PENSPDRAFT_658831, partial [Peniophora sp. CONT]
MSTSNLGRDLGPFQHLRAQKHQFETYILPVEKDPAGAVERLRQLHRDTPIGQENNDLYAWADRMGCVLPRTEFLGRDLWRKLIRAGIVDVCLDIIVRDDFWKSHWYFCNAIVEGTSGIIRYAQQYRDPVAANAIFARTSALWRSIWERREQWKSLRTFLDRGDNFPEPIVELLSEFSELHFNQGRFPSLETYMPHAGLHAWLKYGGDSPVLDKIRNSLLSLMTISQEGCRRFFREAGLSSATIAEATVSGIKREFAQAQKATAFLHLAPLLFALTNCHDLMPFYAKYSLLSEVALLLGRLRDGPGTREEKISGYMNASAYMGQYTELAKEILVGDSPGPLGLRGDDVVTILSLGVDLLAADGGVRVENDLDTDFCERLNDYTRAWKRKKEYKIAEGSPKLLQTFHNDMKARARLDWWPSLHRMQIMVHRGGANIKPQMRKLAENWEAFGKALGLDPAKERARHERDARNRCAWRECQHHREKPDDIVLSTCKGCGEVRYCGRECQKSDWSKGGHKVRCRRL